MRECTLLTLLSNCGQGHDVHVSGTICLGEVGESRSETFSISNGTRQGSIASPDLWSVYLDPLIESLRDLGVWCHVGELFMGVLAYADDLVLLAPNRAAVEQMLEMCESWALTKYPVQYRSGPKEVEVQSDFHVRAEDQSVEAISIGTVWYSTPMGVHRHTLGPRAS